MAILIFHKVNFRVKNITKDKEDYFVINKRVSLSGGHECSQFYSVNLYEPNNKVLK